MPIMISALAVRPGDYFGMSGFSFDWDGPEVNVAVCLGLKADGTGDFNNGEGLISGLWNVYNFLVPGAKTKITRSLGALYGFVTPSPGSYVANNGKLYTVNYGTFDLWLWVADWGKSQVLGIPIYDERTHFLRSTDADVAEIVR